MTGYGVIVVYSRRGVSVVPCVALSVGYRVVDRLEDVPGVIEEMIRELGDAEVCEVKVYNLRAVIEANDFCSELNEYGVLPGICKEMGFVEIDVVDLDG